MTAKLREVPAGPDTQPQTCTHVPRAVWRASCKESEDFVTTGPSVRVLTPSQSCSLPALGEPRARPLLPTPGRAHKARRHLKVTEPGSPPSPACITCQGLTPSCLQDI